MPTLAIRTPEGITFHLLLAGPVPRFLAWVIDAAAVMTLSSTAAEIAQIFAILDPAVAAAVAAILYFAISIGYGIFFEWIWRGQTPGKRVFKLRVVDALGLRLQFNQVAIRNLLRAADMLPAFYVLGGACSLLSPRCQRLGDIAANTVVIRTAETPRPEIEELTGGKYNSMRAFPHLEARLRQTVTPEEAALAVEALRRVKTLDSQERLRLFDDLAAHFKAIVEFPPEASEMISSEQYVRNVVDVIHRRTSV